MLGLDISLTQRSASPIWWPGDARFAADFIGNLYMRDGANISENLAFSMIRDSEKFADTVSGDWQKFSADELARTNRGALIEAGETYFPTNSVFAGATIGVVGAGGQLPSGWDAPYWSEVAVVGLGQDQGFATLTLDLTLDNTGGGGGIDRSILISDISIPPSSEGEFWAGCLYCTTDSVHGDDTCSTPYNNAQIQEWSAGGGFLNNNSGGVLYLGQDLSLRQVLVKTVTNGAAEHIKFLYGWNNVQAGELFHRRITIKMPTLVNRDAVPSQLETTNIANSVREADALTLHLPAGSQELTLTLDDTSTVVVPDVSGDYLVPTNLGKRLTSAIAV